MKLFGYKVEEADSAPASSGELAEITLVATPSELRAIAAFLNRSAVGMEERGVSWEHEHLSDIDKRFVGSPHFVVYNPEAV